jgi:hypothetical protein
MIMKLIEVEEIVRARAFGFRKKPAKRRCDLGFVFIMYMATYALIDRSRGGQ